MLLLTDQSNYGHGKGTQGYQGYYGGQNPQEQMETKETEEEQNEDNSFIGKLKSFFGRGKKKDDSSNQIVGLGMTSINLVAADAY